MWRALLAILILTPFMSAAETTVPQLTDMATTTPTAAEQADDDPSDDSNVGVKVVKNMLDVFKKMGQNMEKFISGKQDFQKYMDRDAELAREVSSNIDYYDVCEKSLRYNYNSKKKRFMSDHWKGKSQADRNQFSNLFQGLVESIAYPMANEYFGDLNMRHKLVKQTANDLHVMTLIKGKKSKKRSREFVVEWFLHPKDNGGWIIYDISIEGERWVPGFRSQFNDVISKKSYKELVSMMRKKLKEEMTDRKRKDLDALAERKSGKEIASKTEENKDGTADKN